MASEHETILILNDEDLKHGFFRFSTTKLNHFTRLCKRIGGEENLLGIETSFSGRRISSWNCRVPKAYLSKATWGVRRGKIERKTKGNAEGLKAWRENREGSEG